MTTTETSHQSAHLAAALSVLLDDNEALTRSLPEVGSGGPGSFPEFGPAGF